MDIFPHIKSDLDGPINMFWSSKIQQPATDMYFPRIELATICAAQFTMLQWTFKRLLATLASDIRAQLAISGDTASPSAQTEQAIPLRFAHWICRSIDY